MAKCPVCKQWLTGYSWTKTKNGKNWLKNTNGMWHDCPKNQKTYVQKMDLTFNPLYTNTYYFCGKCITLCEDDGWCPKCDMYPNVTFADKDGISWGIPNADVGSLQDSNKDQIIEKYRVKTEAPPNWFKMKKDGIMSAGYKLTPDLTKWYEKDGKSILEELYSKIWYRKRDRVIKNK